MSRRFHREFYLLPRGEQRALILLSLLMILSLAFRLVVQLVPAREPEGMEEFEQEARRIMAHIARTDSIQRAREDSIREEKAATPYSSSRSYPTHHREAVFPINLNRADSAQLLPLPGIGPVFAGRIVKYRKLLGGYVRLEQLQEIYGMKEETVHQVRDLLYIDNSAIRTFDLVSATFRELLRHPYLEYEDVKALVNYRDFKGSIESTGELKDNYILTDSVLVKVAPYFNYSKSEAVD